jgi:hypothetical protein
MSTPNPVTTESRIAALEAKLKAEEVTIATWLKANWAHFVTWAAIAAPNVVAYIFKHI